MSSRAWAASGRRPDPPAARSPRPVGSWGAALERARRSWDELTGGPTVPGPGGELVYSDAAAAAILSTALGLWADTAAGLAGAE